MRNKKLRREEGNRKAAFLPRLKPVGFLRLFCDIDLLVEFQDNRVSFDDYVGLLFHLEELLGQKVDLTIPETLRHGLREKILGSVQYVS